MKHGTRTIGGALDWRTLASVEPSSAFQDMTEAEQRRAIHSLANDGFGDHEIARLWGGAR